MTRSEFHRAAAHRHFKTADSLDRSTFDLVTSAALLIREKAARLREARMGAEDAAAAIHLPDLTRRSVK